MSRKHHIFATQAEQEEAKRLAEKTKEGKPIISEGERGKHEAQSEADGKIQEYQAQVAEVLDWAKQHGATVKFVFSTGRYTISLNTLSVEAHNLYEAYLAILAKVQA